MFLKKVTLRDVRALRHLALSFECADAPARRWTILLGENGTGKSTVLRALALLMAGSDALPELLGDPSAWVRNGADAAVLEAEYETADGAQRSARLRIKRGESLSQVLRSNATSLSALDDAIRHSPRNYLTIGYGVSRRQASSGRASLKLDERFASVRARSLATLFNPDAALNSLEGWALDLDYRRGAEGVDLVKSIAREFLPGVTFARIDKERRLLLFKTPDGIVPLAELSEGYQNVAAWCGDLVYRITEVFADYKRPFEARGLLLVDEIDLHLHPIWQRQLRKFLNDRLPNLQIVATTHSALTAQQCGPEELFVLKRLKGAAAPQLLQFPGDPQKLMIHQLLLSDVFGLESLDSPQVQARKTEYRRLDAKRSKSAGDKRRLASLRRELADIPDWTRESDRDLELMDLLRDVRQAVGTSPPAADQVKPPRANTSRARLRRVR